MNDVITIAHVVSKVFFYSILFSPIATDNIKNNGKLKKKRKKFFSKYFIKYDCNFFLFTENIDEYLYRRIIVYIHIFSDLKTL